MIDGAVRFISDTINCGTVTSACPGRGTTPIIGESPYGVWGALGSRDGGESVSL